MRVRTLFQEAVEICDAVERERFLSEACGADARLRARLDELLQAARELGDFLEHPALQPDATVLRSSAVGSSALTITELFDPSLADPLSPGSPTATMTTAPQASKPDERLSFLQPSERSESLGRLGHYEVLERIGQGAFGIVLKARDEKLQRIVAIKVMQPHLAQTSPPRKRFLREARACAAIKHPNVVSVYSVEEEPIPYLVMEYVQGITLQDKIDEAGPLEISEVISLAKQLAHAMQAAHELGLIHRDIKPSNILLEQSSRPRAVITDFGLARTVDDASLTQSGSVTGTPMYMSPEQARGLSLDARSDLFSLGSVLYVVVTGRPPFRASSSMAVLQRVCEASPRPIGEIIPEAPEWLCAMIAKLHAKQADSRFSSAKELADFLDQVEADSFCNARLGSQAAVQRLQQLPPRRNSMSRPAAADSRRRWGDLIWPGGVAALVLLVAVTALSLWRPWHKAEPKAPDRSIASTTGESDSAASVPTHILSLWRALPVGAPRPATAPFDAETAVQLQQEWADYLKVPVEFTNSVGMKFRLIPPGTFQMGCDAEQSAQQLAAAVGMAFWEDCIRSQSPPHSVVVSEPFYLAATEVTQGQYESVMSRNPSVFAATGPGADAVVGLDTLELPVEGLSWNNAANFCRVLSLRDGLKSSYEFDGDQVRITRSSGGYALPTEAQWEMACRAGSTTRYWTGDDVEGLRTAAHFDLLKRPAPVGQLKPNPFGLFDVHGNVNEWVQDTWLLDYYQQCAAEPFTVDPMGPEDAGWHRITKGGDFHYSEGECLSAARFGHDPVAIPIYADGVRPVLPWKSVRDALAAKDQTGTASRDFVEVHGISLTELREWLDRLPAAFVPICFGVRHGSQPPLLDAVARQTLAPAPWQVHLTPDFEADFPEMRAQYRTAWRITVPPANPAEDAPTSLALWIADEILWSTWPIEEEAIDHRLAEMTDQGHIPACLSATKFDGEPWWELSLEHVPGVGHHTYRELTLEAFAQKVELYRARRWRPHLIQIVLGRAEPLLTAVFRENHSGLDWDVSQRISQSEYEQQIASRRDQGFYPAHVVSMVADGQPQFIVLWCRG